MKYKVKGFKRTFVLVFIVALVVAAGSVLYWKQVSHWLAEDARSLLISDAKESTTNISHLLGVQLQVLTAVAVSLDEEKLLDNKARLISYLNEQNRRNSFQMTGFQFADGDTLFSNGRTAKNFLSKQALENIREHSHFVSEPLRSPAGDEEVLVLAVPVRKNHKTAGVVFATQPVQSYAQALGTGSLGDNGISFITNQDGKVLISYPQAAIGNMYEVAKDSVFDKWTSAQTIQEDMRQGRSGVSGYTYRNAHRFSAYFPLGYNDWYVTLVLPTQSVVAKAQQLVGMSLVICLSVIAVLVLLLLFILYLQRQSAKALYRMGFVDPLLKADNLNAFRMKFPEATEAWKEKKTPVALVLVNINQFKAVNDIYGFEQGDRVLQGVARILQEGLQKGELFCRISGDVFLLLMACPDREQLADRIDKILSRAGRECQIEQEQVPLSLTCGIYVLEEEVPFYIMLDRANLAWSCAKQQAGCQHAFYDNTYLQRLVTEKRIEDSMEKALQNDEFKVYLQPKCDFKTGQTMSAEALVRWQHPTQGMIRPDWFIPVFEKNGFVVKLDWHMLRQTVQLLKRWKDENIPQIPIGINFSRLHLEDPDFINQLVQITDEAGIDHKLIEVELTESVVFGNAELMKRVLDDLHAHGFSVAMDDFGAGYSSLNVLKNLDFDCIKLDKEFLAKGEGSPRMRQVISGLVKMVKELGCQVVAEGVETKEQADFLQSTGCDLAQGYLYARPLPIADFEKRLQNQTK